MIRHLNKRGERGNALIEFGLIAPLLLPLILVAVDGGLYTVAFIAVQNGVRVAAMRNAGGLDSAADQAQACSMVIEELRGLPNIGASFSSGCSSNPLIVSTTLCDATTACLGSATSPDGSWAVSVTAQYTVPAPFRFPLVGPTVIARNAQMKIRNIE
jgi:Flp pilus assembly protein TadG